MRWNKFTIKSSPAYGRIIGKHVLVQIAGDEENAPCVAVGRLKYAAGDKSCPYFVVTGFRGDGFIVTHWCDCLPRDFRAPLWRSPRQPLSKD